ncbi:hypothetical protein H8356DRAFT_1339214 [Neocallimastix lanati (nom. inval.)]|nr:hypothetical protein H8356DRAFT_1339214 [Neocallimastix sp. JGI-2020a]
MLQIIKLSTDSTYYCFGTLLSIALGLYDLLSFPFVFYDNALTEQLQISAIPDDRGVSGMTVSPDFQVVERRRQNDKACKDLFLKYTLVAYQ